MKLSPQPLPHSPSWLGLGCSILILVGLCLPFAEADGRACLLYELLDVMGVAWKYRAALAVPAAALTASLLGLRWYAALLGTALGAFLLSTLAVLELIGGAGAWCALAGCGGLVACAPLERLDRRLGRLLFRLRRDLTP